MHRSVILIGAAGALLALMVAAKSVWAEPPAKQSVCLLLDSAAAANGLPVEFLARIIWRESRFQADAVGPATRSGAHAQGIAQFMPATAAERDLADPFDPVQALPKAAAFLRDLRKEFGNLGLAAAAYNAGPQRVRDWLAGTRSLPLETRRYVRAVTGHEVEDWTKPGAAAGAISMTCKQTLASLGRGGSFAIALHARVSAALGHPWGVELAAGFSRRRVLSAYARQTGRLAQVIGQEDAIVTAGILRSRGRATFYRAQIPLATRHAATALCGRIRHAGAACVVVRIAGARSKP